jgi:hypothetical protein
MARRSDDQPERGIEKGELKMLMMGTDWRPTIDEL